MKKKLLVVFTGPMELGGIEKSLIGLLDAIDYEQYSVDLFLYGHHGSLYSKINKNVNILPEVKELAYTRESLMTKIKHGAFYSVWRRIIDGVRHLPNDDSWNLILKHEVKKLSGTYDLAMSFFLPFDLIRDHVDARCKVGWIHTDYSSVEGINYEELRQSYSGLDKIVAVSSTCGETFTKLFPELRGNMMEVENILPQSIIRKDAEAFDGENEMPVIKNGFRLLSIGRYCIAKNFDNVPAICSCLLKKGFKVKWYIIGFGGDEELIRQKIAESKMEEYVILLGKKENPYPYIRACDLYVQPSRYEGKSVTVREAQMFAKPVVITAYPTSGSQLEDGVDGVVVPMDNEGCADGIAKLLNDPKKMQSLSEACRRRDYSNQKEVEKLYELLR